MKRMMTIATAVVGTVLVPLALSVAAQQPDTRDKTIMTFSNAVELPGMRLEPGKYVFRIADSTSRNVIQVLAEDETETLGQWLFVPAERQEVTGDTVVTFRETSATSTPAVQYWYYPGEKIGKEFIYPRDQALRIAARTGATVRTEDGPVTAQTATTRPAVQPSPTTSRPAQGEAEVASAPAREQQRVAAAEPTPPVRDSVRQEATIAQNDTSARTELPSTASPFPFMGLITVLSLAGAAGIRMFRL
jgi:cobalamin biosynthesis Mg chelatase CobN